MDFKALGPLVVRRDGQEVDVGSPKQRSLLALLLIEANQFVPADRILDQLWGADTEGKKGSLHISVSRLRSALEPGRKRGDPSILETRDDSYRLVVDDQSYDVFVVEREVEEARLLVTTDPVAASRRLREALDLWDGPAFDDFAYDDFAQVERTRLAELRIGAIEDRLDADLMCGKAGELVSELELLREQHPLRERLVVDQALALYRAGRPADALRAIDRFRRHVGEELGIDPSPIVVRLEEQILLHDASVQPRVAHVDGDSRTDAVNPFKGLRAFDRDDAAAFFGRDALVADLLRTLRSGQRLVALVGASGSGKSSAIRAGLIPALAKGAIEGSDRWLVASLVPGAHPFAELEAALLRAPLDGPDSLQDQLDGSDEGLLRAALRVLPSESDRLLIVIDQFEELFTMVDDADVQASFLANLVTALDDPHGRVTIVLTLRADFYAQPLEHPEFGARLGNGIVNATSLTPAELEAAAVRPAAIAGVSFEPALLGQLIGDVGNQPSALPLFQFALTELFDRRSGDRLTTETFEAMGGVQGALLRRATDVFESFDEDHQEATRQLLLRLVSVGEQGETSRRRVQAREITSLGVDTVTLHEVIDELGSHRLLSFDSDRLTGSPTVEVAHEALLEAWPTLQSWIDDSRDDLRRHASLRVALGEWQLANRHADYLLDPKRLAWFDDWREQSAITLNAAEDEFLAAGREQVAAAQREEDLRLERERRTRRRLWALVASLAAGLGVAALFIFGVLGGPAGPTVAFFGNQVDDGGWNANIANGLQRGERELDMVLEDVPWVVDPRREFIEFVETEPEIVIIDSLVASRTGDVIAANPDVLFGVLDWQVDAENATYVSFASEEMGYLAGAAAALRTDTGRVGFIGGAEVPFLDDFRAGFAAGVSSIDPDIVIVTGFVNESGDAEGFFRPDLGEVRALDLYGQGVDVIVSAAGSSDFGAFEAAAAHSAASGEHVWMVGLDNDQWFAVPENQKPHILTSIIKRGDVAAFRLVEHMLADGSTGEAFRLGVVDDAFDVSTQGDGLSAEMTTRLDQIVADIAAGEIVVPNAS